MAAKKGKEKRKVRKADVGKEEVSPDLIKENVTGKGGKSVKG